MPVHCELDSKEEISIKYNFGYCTILEENAFDSAACRTLAILLGDQHIIFIQIQLRYGL